MDEVVGGVRNEYILCVIENLYGWIGDRMKVVITNAFIVAHENDNERMWTDLYTDRRLWLGNKYFKRKSLHKHSRTIDDSGKEACGLVRGGGEPKG